MTCGITFMSLYFWSDNRAVFQISALVIHCLTIIRMCKTFPQNGPSGTGVVNRPYWIQLRNSSPLHWGCAEAPRWFGSILKLKNKTNTHANLWGIFCSGVACEGFERSLQTKFEHDLVYPCKQGSSDHVWHHSRMTGDRTRWDFLSHLSKSPE